MRRFLRTTALLALIGGLAACGAGGGSDAGGPEVPGGQVPGGAGGPQDRADGDEGEEGRQVVITGSMTIVVTDPLAAADEAAEVVVRAGGRVDSRSESSGDETSPATAYLTVRIPADELGATLEELETLGDVEDLDLSREDVTLRVTDLDARIEALQVSIDRLQALMAGATSTEDLLAAERALTERQAELDSLTAQRTYLAEQVELSTISISLLPRAAAAAPEPGGFWGGVQRGWNALVDVFNTVVVVLGVLLPWAVLAAVVVGIVLLVRRLLPRRPPRPAPPMAPAGPVGGGPYGSPGGAQPSGPPPGGARGPGGLPPQPPRA
jgi:hypothetical protein